MLNNLIFTGLVNKCTTLQEKKDRMNRSYWCKELLLKADDGSSQSVNLVLTGDVAIQLDTCLVQPETMIRAYLHVYTFEATDAAEATGEVTLRNMLRCWKLELLDRAGNVVFVCRK